MTLSLLQAGETSGLLMCSWAAEYNLRGNAMEANANLAFTSLGRQAFETTEPPMTVSFRCSIDALSRRLVWTKLR